MRVGRLLPPSRVSLAEYIVYLGFYPPVAGSSWMLELTVVCGYLLVGATRKSFCYNRSSFTLTSLPLSQRSKSLTSAAFVKRSFFCCFYEIVLSNSDFCKLVMYKMVKNIVSFIHLFMILMKTWLFEFFLRVGSTNYRV